MANAFLFANADRIPAHSDAAFLFPPYSAIVADKEIQEITNKLHHFLNVRVIDDTALIDAGKPKLRRKNPKLRHKNGKKPPAHVYSRQEMEALNSLDYDKDKWAQVYAALSPAVAAEYDGLVSAPHTDKNHAASPSRFRRRPFFQKPDAVAATGRKNLHNTSFVR